MTLIASLTSRYWRVSVVELTASTQSDLSNLASENLVQNGDVIAAEFQSAGRGRLERSFDAPAGSALLFSFFLSPKRKREDWGFVAHLAALSMHTIVAKSVDTNITLKWPNDILINDKKVAGLLAQMTNNGLIIGMGLNVEMTSEELPVPTATSLAIAGSNQLDRNKILSTFLNQFASDFQEWDSGRDFIDEYSSASGTLGREVQVEVVGRDNRMGVAQSVTTTGALLLSDGFEVNVGDVVHLR